MVTLVTGGTGYLGGRLVTALLAAGGAVRVMVRPGTPANDMPAGAQVVVGDLAIADDPIGAMDGVQCVYHLGSLNRHYRLGKENAFQLMNVNGTRHVLQAARLAGVKRVVHCSTIYALGPSGDHVRDESVLQSKQQRQERLHNASPYERSIAESSEIAQSFTGVEVIRAYPGLIYGPGNHDRPGWLTTVIDYMADHAHPQILAPGNRRRTTAFLEDVVQGLIACMENGTPGEAYILGGEEVDYAQLADMVGDILDRPLTPHFAHPTIRKLTAWGSEFTGKIWASNKPRLTRMLLEMEEQQWRYSSQKAIAELGYTRTPIKEGLRRTLEWLGHLSQDPDRQASSP